MYRDKWNEICFLLSEKIHKEISEGLFEKHVVQALSVLNWKEFLDDLDIRPSFQIGASNRITPDFIVKSENQEKLFVIEIKQPHLTLSLGFQKQLFSYMRQLRLEYGLLIGKEIQIFYDGDKIKHEDPIILETIKFERDSAKGERFVELFSKNNFSKDGLDVFTNEFIVKRERKKQIAQLTQELLSEDYKNVLSETVKKDLSTRYDEEVVNAIIEKFNINISEKFSGTQTFENQKQIEVKDRFVGFANRSNRLSRKEKSKNFSTANSRVEEETTFEINNRKYHLRRFDNKMIRILDSNNEIINEMVKPVLRKIIETYNLDVHLERKPGIPKTTQVLGREVIQAMKNRMM